MRRTALGLLLLLLSASCAGPGASQRTALTPAIADTPTTRPAMTPTRTPTRTPTQPPTPEGATAFDEASGRFTRTVNGTTFYWFPLKINAADTAEGHWFASHILAGDSIPLLDRYANPHGDYPDMIPMRVYFIEDLKQLTGEPYLVHPDGSNFYTTDAKEYSAQALQGCSFTESTIYALAGRRTGHVCTPTKCDMSSDDESNVLRDVKGGSLELPFTVPANTQVKADQTTRVSYEWQLVKGYDVFVINWDDADPARDPSFVQSETGLSRVRWKVMTVDGTLVSIIATSAEAKVQKDAEFVWMLLAGFASVEEGQDVYMGKYASGYGQANRALGRYSCRRTDSSISLPILPHIQLVASEAAITPVPTRQPLPAAQCQPTPADNVPTGVTVVKDYPLDSSDLSSWGFDLPVITVEDGCLKLIGQDYRGGVYKTTVREGSGMLVTFRFTAASAGFGMYLDNGTWNTSAYKRFGAAIASSQLQSSMFIGKKYVSAPLAGMNAGTWYQLLLAVGKNGDFTARLWDLGTHTQLVAFTKSLGPDWAGLPWSYHIEGAAGTMFIDDIKEVTVP